MTMMRAVVKYPMNASRDEKVAELKQGLGDVAMELVGEHGVSLEQVEDWLDDALEWAHMEAEQSQGKP